MSEQLDAALLDGWRDLPAEDQDELRKFVAFLRRRHDNPSEPVTHAYAETHGEVVFEDLTNHMLRVGGSSFYCHCGSNVFHRHEDGEPGHYRCNGCNEGWTGEPDPSAPKRATP